MSLAPVFCFLCISFVWTVNKKCYLIEFKRTRDRRHSYEARAMEVARRQYESLMGGLRAIGEQRGWEIEQLVFVGGTCGRSSKGGVFQQEPQATGGARRQVESSTTANGKKTFGSTRHSVKGVFCTEVRTNDSVWGRKKSRCRTERPGASRIRCVRVSDQRKWEQTTARK